MAEDKYRLVTRSDFDGLVSALLLKELDLIDNIKFVHPKDVQDGIIEITESDITTNLPYANGAHYAFDHHISELARVGIKSNYMLNPTAPSAARVVWDCFGGAAGFPNIPEEIMNAVDQADSAKYTIEEIMNPSGWTLLSFIMDARTGLGRFHNFRISNYQLMMDLIDYCRKYSVDEILQLADMALYMEHGVSKYFGKAVDVLNKAAVKISGHTSYNTIFEGEIEKYDEESSTALIKFGGGYVESSCEKVEKGRKIRFSVNIHDVVLSIKKPEGISIRNIYKGKVIEIIKQPNNFYDVLIDIGDNIWARISKGAFNELAVTKDCMLFVMIKSAAISDTLKLVH